MSDKADSLTPPNNGNFLVCFERFELRLLLSSIPQQFSEAHPGREHNQGWPRLKGKAKVHRADSFPISAPEETKARQVPIAQANQPQLKILG